MPENAYCLRVKKSNGERVLALAKRLAILNRALEIQKDNGYLYIPLVRKPEEKEVNALRAEAQNIQIMTKIFLERQQQRKTLIQVLGDKLPPYLLTSVPRALDIVGDIAIVEIPIELEAYEAIIGEAILAVHKNVRTVLAKASVVSGTYRLREFKVIAGEHKTTTVHKEYGCKYHVDIAKAYFSPRLSQEHYRVASLVSKNEVVVDLFSGVGPFAVLIAKKNDEAKVYAVDINPDAVALLKRNIRLNRVENRVIPIQGDAKQVIEKQLAGIADRVIMNLPEKAIGYVDVACKALKDAGGIIHFYCFIRRPNSLEEMKLCFSNAVEKTGRKVAAFLFARSVRETAPYEQQMVLDAKII